MKAPQISWPDAQAAAAAKGGYLATITSQAENDFLNSHKTVTYFWLGGYQPDGSLEPDGGWTWVTGEAFGYRNWSPTEPNNNNGVEKYIEFDGTLGSWNDNLLETGPTDFGYVIEYGAPSTPNSLQNSLLAFYPFSGNAADASGNGYDGTPANTTPVPDRGGTPNTALQFNGNSTVVEVGKIFPMSPQQTIVAWLKPNTTSAHGCIVEKAVAGYGGEADFWLDLESGGRVSWYVNTDNGDTGIFAAVLGSTVLKPGKWTCVAAVIDKSNNQIRLYVDGVQDGTANMGSRNVRNTNRPFRIGKRIGNQSAAAFRGGLDDVRVYGRVLSEAEIFTLANADGSLPPSLVTQPASQTLQTGGQATLSVTAAGSTPLSYQWYQNGSPVSGATSASLVFSNLKLGNGGSYTVQVSNLFGRATSQPAKLTVLSNLDGTVIKPNYPPPPSGSAGKDSIVFITHGRTTTNPPDIAWISKMKTSILARVPSNWFVVDYPWTDFSQVGIFQVIADAQYVGRKAGQDLVDLAQLTTNRRWEHVHFIAHSAGSALVEEAARRLRQAFPQAEIHTTLLDPYTGPGDSLRKVYGSYSTWTDNYFDIDLETGDDVLTGATGVGPYGRTSGPLLYAFNVDVTALDPEKTSVPVWCAQPGLSGQVPCGTQAVSTHGWPIKFYQNTIPPGQQPGANGFGFGLSTEAGSTTRYSPNTTPLVLGASSSAVQGPINQSSNPAFDFSALPSAISQTGTVQTNGMGFSASTGYPSKSGLKQRASTDRKSATASDTTAPPAWISIAVETSTNVSSINFDASFNKPGASGMITVYWNDQEIGKIDQDYVVDSSRSYTFAVPNAFLDKSNCLGFRVDSFSSDAASISISNVRPSNASSDAPSLVAERLSADRTTLTLIGIQGYTYEIQASTDLQNWSILSTVKLQDGPIAEFIDLDASSFSKRFYRATLP